MSLDFYKCLNCGDVRSHSKWTSGACGKQGCGFVVGRYEFDHQWVDTRSNEEIELAAAALESKYNAERKKDIDDRQFHRNIDNVVQIGFVIFIIALMVKCSN